MIPFMNGQYRKTILHNNNQILDFEAYNVVELTYKLYEHETNTTFLNNLKCLPNKHV